MFSLKRQSHYKLNVKIQFLLFFSLPFFISLSLAVALFFLYDNVLCFCILSHHVPLYSYGLVLGSISLRVVGNAKACQRSYWGASSARIS